MAAKISEIYFVRHGESTNNVEGTFVQENKHWLTAKGEKQAQNLIKVLRKEKFDLIVTSSYERTQLTAWPLLKKHKKDFVVWPVQEFTPLPSKRYSKLTIAERRRLNTAYWEKCDPGYQADRGTENYIDFIKRIDAVKKRILKGNFKKIVIFTHGAFIRHFIWRNFYPRRKIDNQAMLSGARVGWGLAIKNTEIIKAIKINNKLYFGELDSRHLKN
ncbi:MAG: histidine phosphatase family protein [Patescibacteria group bacterium]|jgi:broad specificity phosphatase PhoE